MQYLLSEQEYLELKNSAAKERASAEKIIQDLCSQVADNLPVVVPWDGGLNEKLPWGCILTKEGDGVCDGCPVQDVCPHPHKSWSK